MYTRLIYDSIFDARLLIDEIGILITWIEWPTLSRYLTLTMCMFICMTVYLPTYLSVCLLFCLSVSLPVYLPAWLFMPLPFLAVLHTPKQGMRLSMGQFLPVRVESIPDGDSATSTRRNWENAMVITWIKPNQAAALWTHGVLKCEAMRCADMCSIELCWYLLYRDVLWNEQHIDV